MHKALDSVHMADFHVYFRAESCVFHAEISINFTSKPHPIMFK